MKNRFTNFQKEDKMMGQGNLTKGDCEMKRLSIVKGDIVKAKTDAIVNAANTIVCIISCKLYKL